MEAGMKSFLILAVTLPLLFSCTDGEDSLMLMSYNLENLFDGDCNGTEYREYIPETGGWSSLDCRQKCENLAAVITEAVPGGPDILLLQEVENEAALTGLIRYIGAPGYPWGVLPDDRGNAVRSAVLTRYQPETIRIHGLDNCGTTSYRSIPEIRISHGTRHLAVFCCHWKSRSGGTAETEDSRLLQSRQCAFMYHRIRAQSPGAMIIFAGDFNQTAGAPCLSRQPQQDRLWITPPDGAQPDMPGLVDMNDIFIHEGSYVYRGNWELIDHILVSPEMLISPRPAAASFAVFRRDFFLNRFGYPKPYRGSGGTGYSDHLPLVLKLCF
jgi:endonuclease/exonuclease/phosphatase family metal-dependent hydrolase